MQPLAGITVIDMSRILAGPWAGQVLADLGATVIKIERPEVGDDTRHWGPPYLKDREGNDTKDAAYFFSANRGKQSISIDITQAEGQQQVKELIATADVVIENYKLGGLATWFLRPGGHIFDVSLHGFPHGMIKSCRRYWSKDIADRIVQLKNIRFDNPQFSLTTTFNREDFTRLLTTDFGIEPQTVNDFFDTARSMNFFDDQSTTTRQLFDRFFPGRDDVVRLLMEPITYANGSTLEDPAITYGIVFSNFMNKGVFIYEGGTEDLVARMKKELVANGVDIRINCGVDRIQVKDGKVAPLARVRTQNKAMDALVNYAKRLEPFEDVAVMHTHAPELAEKLAKKLKQKRVRIDRKILITINIHIQGNCSLLPSIESIFKGIGNQFVKNKAKRYGLVYVSFDLVK